jgi:predicted peptidase
MLNNSVFEKRVFIGSDAEKLPFRLLKPEPCVAGRKFPLVIFLHGSGERGSDNELQLTHCVREFTTPANRAAYPCFVLVPQCEERSAWNAIDWDGVTPLRTSAAPARSTRLLLELLPQLCDELPIDRDRLYLSGISLGGFGTWDLAIRNPRLFAAAAPICGRADDAALATLAHLPVWVFHGSDDEAVLVDHSRSAVRALQNAGSTVVKYTEYAGVGHNSWDRTFSDPEFFRWLFAQRR